MITRGLGVDYLWIDALCIVQDDRDEWLRKAEVMGSVYEKATLMISASGSSDANGGCFVTKRSEANNSLTTPIVDPREEE